MFGTIWSWFRSFPCLTLEEYKIGVSACFSDSIGHVDLVDLYVIPDYRKFLEGHHDSLDRWAKTNLTVHQFHFERVPANAYFPHGVRIRYRDYVSPRVVELQEVDKRKAMTRIGQLTGLDPVTHYSRWFPIDPVEGFSLLRRIPCSHVIDGIEPMDFYTESIKSLISTRSAILKSQYFKVGSCERQW